MNALPKFVASTTLSDAAWSNTTIIADDVPNAVARMKLEPGGDIALIGSSHLASTLAAHGLIDEFRFFVVPGQAGPRRSAGTAGADTARDACPALGCGGPVLHTCRRVVLRLRRRDQELLSLGHL
jgi:hypothetical protein